MDFIIQGQSAKEWHCENFSGVQEDSYFHSERHGHKSVFRTVHDI